MRVLFVLTCALMLSACVTPAPAENVSIKLERTSCFGFCPDYDVTITGDGQVIYHGNRSVHVTGEQHGTASHEDVARLVRMIDDAHFFELKDRYAAPITDLPEYRVTFQRGDRVKRVVDYAGGAAGMPNAVHEIEVAIDRIANTDQWTKNPEGGSARP